MCWLWVLVAEIKWVPATCPCLMAPYLYLIDSNICEDICGRYSTTQLLTCPKLIKYYTLINQANLFRIFNSALLGDRYNDLGSLHNSFIDCTYYNLWLKIDLKIQVVILQWKLAIVNLNEQIHWLSRAMLGVGKSNLVQYNIY